MRALFDICKFFQGFAKNFNPFYQGEGLLGHPGIDEGCGFGSDVHSSVHGKVIAMYTPEKPANDGYVAVYILVQTAYELFEFTVGHLSHISVQIGQVIKRGDLIGREGNRGIVYAGGRLITLAEQKAGSKEGSHRHYQCRPVIEVKKRTDGNKYLRNAVGYIKGPTGGYLEYALPQNGYAGCVDFTGPLFPFDLSLGDRGYYVLLLQKILGAPAEEQTGYFGTKTMDRLKTYQVVNGIPDTGYFGPTTREKMSTVYNRMRPPLESVQAEIEQVEEVLGTVPTLPLEEERKTVISWLLDVLARLGLRIGG